VRSIAAASESYGLRNILRKTPSTSRFSDLTRLRRKINRARAELNEKSRSCPGEAEMLSGPKGSEDEPYPQCSVCGHRADLVELPGMTEKYCLECSADVATTILLKTEINAAWLSGLHYEGLAAELAQLGKRMLERAQSA
jgi:hypothetical protein